MAVNVEKKPTAAFALSILAGIFTLVISITWLLYNNAAQRKLGSTLVLVFSILSMNFIGLILGLIGGFLGFSYKPTASTTNTSSSSRGYNPP